jgi:hypothetical protein
VRVSFRSSSGRVAGALALIFSGVLLAFAIAELVLRLLGIGQQGMYQWDADRGWALRPGASGWQHREGNAFVRINRDGMRDREHSYSKPADTIRIAFIGDSFTEGEQVPEKDDFVSIVDQRLGTCGLLHGKKVETLNFGCDSYGTAQELATLRKHVWKFSPDVVVLVFFPGNDIRNNSLTLEWHLCQPFYFFRGDQFVLGGPFINSPLFRTECEIKFESRRSAVLNVVGDAIIGIRSKARARRAALEERRRKTTAASQPGSGTAAQPAAAIAPVEPGIVNAIYEPPQTRVWKDAWKVTEKLITTINDEVTRHGARFLVVTATVGPQVFPDRAWRAVYENSDGVSSLLYPDSRIEQLGRRAGFPVLDLAPAFQAYADRHHVFLHGFDNTKLGVGHWNAAGHRLAGELMAGRLCDLLGSAGSSDHTVNLSRQSQTSDSLK